MLPATLLIFSCSKEISKTTTTTQNSPATSQNDRIKGIEAEQPNDQIYRMVEQLPQFPGGENEMKRFINKQLIYPAAARENNEEGRVIVEFVVMANGEIKSANIVRGVSESLDQEALRVIRLMPKWIPGKQNGQPVNVIMVTPITFQLSVGPD